MLGDEPAAMANMLVVTPHPSLAAAADPLKLAGELRDGGDMPTLDQVKSKAREELSSLLEKAAGGQIERAASDGASDRDWYWVAPLLLDLYLFEETTTNWWMTSASTVGLPRESMISRATISAIRLMGDLPRRLWF